MEHFDKETINERVKETIDTLLVMQLDGCIAGSCVLANDFTQWESEPDVDFFSYNDNSWVYAVSVLISKDRYKPGSKKDEWKISRIAQGKHRNQKNRFITQTIYLKDTVTGIYINLSYKPGCSNITDVLSRFDIVANMIGICCRTQKLVDLRCAFYPATHKPEVQHYGDANPIRLWYMAEGWDENTWSRELARIKKYEGRGFAMQGMAIDMLGVASRVLERGDVVGSEKSKARYLNLLLSCYRAVVWLEEFVNSNKPEGYDILSNTLFSEIRKLIQDLPVEVQEELLQNLSEPLIPEGDKVFEPEEEEDEDEEADDR